jgi:hypothetical protein
MYQNYPFLKDLLDVFMRDLLGKKTKLGTTNGRYLLRMDLAHALSTNFCR